MNVQVFTEKLVRLRLAKLKDYESKENVCKCLIYYILVVN